MIAKLCELLMEKVGPWPLGTEKKNLLWDRHLAKACARESISSSNVGSPNEKTQRKWAWLVLDGLAFLTFDVVSD